MLQKKIIRLAEIDDNSGKGEVIREKSNINNTVVTFDAPTTRVPPASGDKISTIIGKILKYILDLKLIAFTGSYKDLRDAPSNLAPAEHKHSKSDITDFPSSLPASDVYSWAKSSSKPSYTAGEVGGLPISGGTITGGLSVVQGLSLGGNISFAGGAFQIDKGYYSGSYHVAVFWDGVNKAGISFTSQGKDFCFLHPHADGKGTLGIFNYKWKDIYAVNSSISTSDKNLKKEISYIGQESNYKDTVMTDEQLIQLILGLKPVVFKRINGESGRPHHGFIAQDFEELMTGIGLHDHAAFIKSPKTEEIEIAKEDGSKEIKIQEIPCEYIYGIRYEELISDIIRFCQILYQQNQEQEKKIEELENRIKILEDKITV